MTISIRSHTRSEALNHLFRRSRSHLNVFTWTLMMTICAIILVYAQPVFPQSSSENSETKRLEDRKTKAQLERDIAQAEKDRAEAEAAALKARVGSITTPNLPQGTAKVDDKVVIEANYIAYMAARSAASRISNDIGCPKVLVFFSSKELDAQQTLAAIQAQITLIESSVQSGPLLGPVKLKRLRDVANVPQPLSTKVPVGSNGQALYELIEPPTQFFPQFVPPAAIFAAVDAALSVIALFKTDVEFHGAAVSSDDLALQIMVAEQLKTICKDKPSIIHPAYFYAPMIPTDQSGSLLKRLTDLANQQATLTIRSGELDQYVQTPLANSVESIKKQQTDAQKARQESEAIKQKLNGRLKPEEKKELEAALNKLQDRLAQTPSDDVLSQALAEYQSDLIVVEARINHLKDVATKINELLTTLGKPDPTGTTPLQTLLRAESLSGKLGDDPWFLVVKFVSIGGNNITKKNVFTTKLSFSGGAVTEYMAINKFGLVQKANVVSCYGGHIKEDDLVGTFNSNLPSICNQAPRVSDAR